MNTPTEWKTTAKVYSPERLAFWQEVFGGDTIPIKSFIPSAANLPGNPGALAYELDLRAITAEQREKLIAGLANKFNLPVEEVAAGLDVYGVPVLAEDVTVATTDRALFMGLVL